MSSPEMCRRVHTPSHVERKCISEQGTDVKSIVDRFVPQQMWHISGNQKAAQKDQWQVESTKRK